MCYKLVGSLYFMYKYMYTSTYMYNVYLCKVEVVWSIIVIFILIHWAEIGLAPRSEYNFQESNWIYHGPEYASFIVDKSQKYQVHENGCVWVEKEEIF